MIEFYFVCGALCHLSWSLDSFFLFTWFYKMKMRHLLTHKSIGCTVVFLWFSWSVDSFILFIVV